MTRKPHVSFSHWTTRRDALGPCVIFLVDHVSWPKLPTRLLLIRLRGFSVLHHLLDFYWCTCHVVALTRVIHWFVHASMFYLTTLLVLFLPRAQQPALQHQMRYITNEPKSNNSSSSQQQSTDGSNIKPLHEFTTPNQQSNHTCPLHQEDWELPALKSLLYSCCFSQLHNLSYSLLCLPLQFIHLSDEASWPFLFSSKLFPKRFLYQCLRSGGPYLDTGILQIKGVATATGGDLGNNISARHWFLPISFLRN